MSIEPENSRETEEPSVDAPVTPDDTHSAEDESVESSGVDETQSPEAPESSSDDAAEPDAVTADVSAAEPSEGAAAEADASLEGEDRGQDDDDDGDDDEDDEANVEPLELIEEDDQEEGDLEKRWYILKVQVNREESIRDALQRRVKIEGLERYFEAIVVPTEDVAEFTKSGKRRIVKRKLYPGYIMVNMAINDDSWFLVRETPGIGDFTGSAGKPTPMDLREVERILHTNEDEDEERAPKTSIPFSIGERVRVKEGNFQNFEGDVEKIDEAHGVITVVIPIFNRPTPVDIQYWQIEKV